MKPENPHKDLPYRIRNRDLCYDNDDMQEEKHDAWQEGYDTLKSWLLTDCDNPGHRFKGLKYECPECMKELE